MFIYFSIDVFATSTCGDTAQSKYINEYFFKDDIHHCVVYNHHRDDYEIFWIRELNKEDVMDPTFLKLLERLTDVDDDAAEYLEETFLIKQQSGIYKQLGLFNHSGIQGTATMIIEYKYAKGKRPAILIEDVVIAKGHGGKNLGLFLMDEIHRISVEIGCYKEILTCNETLATKKSSPYVKAGFKSNAITMRRDHAIKHTND